MEVLEELVDRVEHEVGALVLVDAEQQVDGLHVPADVRVVQAGGEHVAVHHRRERHLEEAALREHLSAQGRSLPRSTLGRSMSRFSE